MENNIETFNELINLSDYSFVNNLNSDPNAKYNGDNKFSTLKCSCASFLNLAKR